MNTGQMAALVHALKGGWDRYVELFGEPPHGTRIQLSAVVELVRAEDMKSVLNEAVAERTREIATAIQEHKQKWMRPPYAFPMAIGSHSCELILEALRRKYPEAFE